MAELKFNPEELRREEIEDTKKGKFSLTEQEKTERINKGATMRENEAEENTVNTRLLIERAKEEKAQAAAIAEEIKDRIFKGSMQLDIRNAKAIGDLMLEMQQMIANNNLAQKLSSDKELLNIFTEALYKQVKKLGVENIKPQNVAEIWKTAAEKKEDSAA